MTLERLPAEIIYEICEKLCRHCDKPPWAWKFHHRFGFNDQDRLNRKTLLKLSSLCKRWGRIAQKVLHHYFGYTEETPVAAILFCRTISQDPDLALQVKNVKLRHIDTSYNPSPIESWVMNPLNRFSALLDFPGPIFDPDMSNWESFVAPLILLQVPNLKCLDATEQENWLVLNQFNKPAVVHQRALPLSIRTMLVGCGTLDKWLNRHGFRIALDLSQDGIGGILPALKSLQSVEIISPVVGTARDLSQLHNIVDLAFVEAALTKEDVQAIVSTIARLEVFSYIQFAVPGDKCASGQEICQALALRKDTLQAVHIHCFESSGPFAAATQLVNVKVMSIMADAIWNPSEDQPVMDRQALIGSFPPSLKRLDFMIHHLDAREMMAAFMSYIVSVCRSHRMRVLEYVVVHVTICREDYDDEVLEYKAMFARVVNYINQILRRQRNRPMFVVQASWAY